LRTRLEVNDDDWQEQLQNYFILGYLNPYPSATLTDPGSKLLVCGRDDGAFYLEHPETGRALFCGYAEMLGLLHPAAGR
jgi:hypothetical protein